MSLVIKGIDTQQHISKRSSFPYRRLNHENTEIRLLVLLPGKGASVVEIEIFHTTLDQNPNYEALSYCWGEPSDTTPICLKAQNEHSIAPRPGPTGLLNTASLNMPKTWVFPNTLDSPGIYQFQATVNLESALRQLRHETEARTLWVDAICINQQDDSEKGHQVRQMDQVYKRCSRVCIWLGPAADNSDAAMDMLHMISRGAEIAQPEDDTKPFDALALLFLKDDRWVRHCRALLQLYCRPWFFRLWGKLSLYWE